MMTNHATDSNRKRPAIRATLLGLLLLPALLLSACGGEAPSPTPVAVPAQTNVPIMPTQTPAPAMPTTAPTTAPAIEPTAAATSTAAASGQEQAVRRFLDAVFGSGAAAAPDEAAARSMLDAALLDKLGNKPVVTLLGVQNAPRGYTIAPNVTPEVSIPENAYITAVLDYESGPVTVNFSLALAGGAWQITAIAPLDSTTSSPEGTVLAFLNLVFGPGAGSAENEAATRKLLAADYVTALADKPTMTLIGVPNAPLRYSVARSPQPEVSIPERAYFDARLDYESATEVRHFSLALGGNGWRISAIERVPDLATETPTK